MTQTVCLRIVYAGIGGILLTHTNTLFRGYKSKLFSLSKKSKSPIVSFYLFHAIPYFCQYWHFLVMQR